MNRLWKRHCFHFLSLSIVCWSWKSNTLDIWYEDQTQWKRSWFQERLKAKGEGGGREWDGQIVQLTQWTWANFGRQWRLEEPVVLQSPWLQATAAVLFTRQGKLFSFYFLSGLVTNYWLSRSNFFHILSLSHSVLLPPELRHRLMFGAHWNKAELARKKEHLSAVQNSKEVCLQDPTLPFLHLLLTSFLLPFLLQTETEHISCVSIWVCIGKEWTPYP